MKTTDDDRVLAYDNDGFLLAVVPKGYGLRRRETEVIDEGILVLRPDAQERLLPTVELTPQQLRRQHLARERAKAERSRRPKARR